MQVLKTRHLQVRAVLEFLSTPRPYAPFDREVVVMMRARLVPRNENGSNSEAPANVLPLRRVRPFGSSSATQSVALNRGAEAPGQLRPHVACCGELGGFSQGGESNRHDDRENSKC